MSDLSPLRAYRACVNLPEASNGQTFLIDESDDRWADRIARRWIVPVGPPVDYEPPSMPITRDNPPPAELPVSEPSEMVEKEEVGTDQTHDTATVEATE